jgi:membrane-associated phospholipid phosphatase
MDSSLYRSINRFQVDTPWLHGVLAAFAGYGIVYFGLAVLIGWWFARSSNDLRSMALVIWTVPASLIALELAQIIGGAINRARPYAVMPASHVLIAHTTDFSFPSDHATAAGAIAIGLVFAAVSRRAHLLAWITVAAAVLISFSRLYCGVHYPGDVVGGLLLGGIVAAIGVPLATRFITPLVRKVSESRIRTLVLSSAP